jgi:creatinine amidohydrolase
MKPKSIRWGDHTWEELAQIARAGAVVVVPFGSTEQHGPMLPVDTDIRIAEKRATDGAELAAQRDGIPVLVLPTMPYGLAAHHMSFAGTIALQPETYVAVVAEILDSVIAHGFRRIAVLTGHGGNTPGLQLGLTKAVHASSVPAHRAHAALFQPDRDPAYAACLEASHAGDPPEPQPALHAARAETSQTLADRPHLVRRDRMVKPALNVTERPEWTFTLAEISVTGATGDPSLARAEIGERRWQCHAEAVARFIRRVWEFELPNEGGLT